MDNDDVRSDWKDCHLLLIQLLLLLLLVDMLPTSEHREPPFRSRLLSDREGLLVSGGLSPMGVVMHLLSPSLFHQKLLLVCL